jgi:hypothetical protein
MAVITQDILVSWILGIWYRARRAKVNEVNVSLGLPTIEIINQELTLDFHSNPGAPRFVVCQSRQSHEADSLIAVLFE